MENQAVQDIQKTIVLEAPIQQVWEKVATSEGIAQWFMPSDLKLEEGYEFHLQSPFGPSPCKVLKVEAPHQLSFAWDTDGWVVSFILKDLGDKTEFTLVHGGWKQADVLLPKANEKSAIVRERMDYGWTAIVNEKLRKAIEG
ncbi:SRPBCC family protein [Ectobacillus ponti]|uniref:SRPBCC domain-containing protein n=1 Tax=Ectobacillus ponti TaxID=2961894 RepID=A0AA41XCT0_9BACI|nr:SRPBCC domain-containing protein [Ectobacillus ponti]MCP8970969.1 SRPBCC domain-containing protein [Ectobacillus ponti]